jgi:hypothetical protein
MKIKKIIINLLSSEMLINVPSHRRVILFFLPPEGKEAKPKNAMETKEYRLWVHKNQFISPALGKWRLIVNT